jgi:hypothetical protein
VAEQGYTITILFVYLETPEVCIKRVKERVLKGMFQKLILIVASTVVKLGIAIKIKHTIGIFFIMPHMASLRWQRVRVVTLPSQTKVYLKYFCLG